MSAGAMLCDALTSWTGFPHVLFVQSGSAALALALEVSLPEPGRVALPGLACWTLTGTVLDRGHEPIYVDVDPYLGIGTEGKRPAADAVIAVEPWGSACDWSGMEAAAGVKIADLTLSIQGGWPGVRMADVFDCAVISLGRGKPLDIGAGGILLLRDEETWRRARVRLTYGRQKLRWAMRTERYVFAPALLEPLAERWRAAAAAREAQAAARERWAAALRARSLPLEVVPVRPGARTGYASLIPLLLPPDYPLSAEEVYAVAIREQIPIGTQPVTPPYREPAGAGLRGACPRAESVASRLLFASSGALDRDGQGGLERLESLFRGLERDPAAFRRPYRVSEPPAPIPAPYAYWRDHGIVCRGLDGSFCVHDPIHGKAYQVNESVVAALQEESRDAFLLSRR